MSADVQGRCPACGSKSLFLGAGGWVTCGWAECTNPTALADIIEHTVTHHIITIKPHTFAITHPLIERLGGELHDCPFDQYLSELDGPPRVAGRYVVYGPPPGVWKAADLLAAAGEAEADR